MSREASSESHSNTSKQAPKRGRESSADDDSNVVEFFDRLGAALTNGDARAIASAWGAPALVVDDGGVVAVRSVEEVEKFFAGARAQYADRGITATRAEIVRVTWVGARVALAEVRWPMLDRDNREVGEERSTYTLRSNDEGELEIRVALSHAVPTH
jgi:limonene-1,2-epoxide hydrolase